MAASMDLSIAKKNLTEVLGDSMKLYLDILKSWFKQKITREDFDHEARKLMSPETVHLHNQFLLAILSKCQLLGSNMMGREKTSKSESSHASNKVSKKMAKKRKAHNTNKTHIKRHLAVDPLSVAPQLQVHAPDSDERGPGYMCREMVLPDIGMVHGRMIVTAWDFGLEDVQDDAVRLLMQAIEIQLKTIITTILARRNGYKIRDGCFKYAIGSQVPSSYLRSTALHKESSLDGHGTSVTSKGIHMPTMRPSVDTADRDASVYMALSDVHAPKCAVSLFDMFEALQTNKSAIPSHTVYTGCMERLINRLWHPSHEELAARQLQKQELEAKRNMQARQTAVKAL